MRNRVFTAARDAVSPKISPIVAPAKSEEVFPIRWIVVPTLCSGIFMVMCLFLVLISLILFLQGYPLVFSLSQLGALACALLLKALLCILISQTFPVRVSEKGITSTDFWGRKVTLSWAEIETAEAKRLITLPYLLVKSFRKDRLVMWLPLFVRSPKELQEAISHHASPNNPLRRYLEDEQEPERELLRA